MDEKAFGDAMARRLDEQFDRAFFGTTTGTLPRPAQPLTLDALDRAIDAIRTDRRTLIVGRTEPLVEALAPFWTLTPAKGEPGFWLERRSEPRWRIKVYCSDLLDISDDTIYIIDPEAAGAPMRLRVGEALTAMTALALAEVDERVGA